MLTFSILKSILVYNCWYYLCWSGLHLAVLSVFEVVDGRLGLCGGVERIDSTPCAKAAAFFVLGLS